MTVGRWKWIVEGNDPGARESVAVVYFRQGDQTYMNFVSRQRRGLNFVTAVPTRQKGCEMIVVNDEGQGVPYQRNCSFPETMADPGHSHLVAKF